MENFIFVPSGIILKNLKNFDNLIIETLKVNHIFVKLLTIFSFPSNAFFVILGGNRFQHQSVSALILKFY